MISQKHLKSIINYNPSTGFFTWLSRPADMFSCGNRSAKSYCDMWNSRYSGKIAGTISDMGMNGIRRCIVIKKKQYFSYRLAWLYVYGVWPECEIDHINGNSLDDRIVNLRDVTSQENSRNSRIPTTNISGIIGVRFRGDKGKWVAGITVNNKSIHLGYFDDLFSAACARISKQNSLGFHNNHGRKCPIVD